MGLVFENNDDLVSVIIPVYNVELYLEEAIESVINQSYSKLDIVIVDDGSTDGSADICDRFAKTDKRINVIHQNNKGLSSARNTGLEYAKGKYVSFLDPDDAFHHQMIEIMLSELRAKKADIIICDYSNHFTQGKLNNFEIKKNSAEFSSQLINKEESFERIIDGKINTAVWNRMYVKEIWNNLRFPEGIVYEGTYVVFDIFKKADRIAILDTKLIMHRIRYNSICNTCSLKNVHDIFVASDHFIKFVIDNTPSIFNNDQLEKMISSRIRGKTASYLWFICNNPYNIKGRKILKNMIKNNEEDFRLYHCGNKLIIEYYLIMFFPYTCSLIYYLYRNIYKRIKINLERV